MALDDDIRLLTFPSADRGVDPPSSHDAAPSPAMPCPRGAEALAARQGWVLGDVAGVMGFDGARHARASRGLQPLREPLRRTLLETLACRPQPMSGRLLEAIGGTPGDLHQRLRTLRQAGLVTVERHHIYKVDPTALEAIRGYFDLVLCAASLSPSGASPLPLDLDLALEALAEPTRRTIFEYIVIRPRRVSELAGLLPMTRQNISHHVRVLGEAGLIRHDPGTLSVITEALPPLRTYFDRLWLEASLGDTWLRQRRISNSD